MRKGFKKWTTLLLATGVVTLIAGVLIIAGCKDELLPTGSLNPIPGAPGGRGQGAFPNFDINSLPSVKFWNDRGHYHNLPPLFQFADGSPVTTLNDWEKNGGRRDEIAKILEYYWLGFYPGTDTTNMNITPLPVYLPDVTLVEYQDPNNAPLASITGVQYFKAKLGIRFDTGPWNGKSGELVVGVRLPDTPQSPGTKVPVLINLTDTPNIASWTWLQDDTHNWARINFAANDIGMENSTHTGLVASLFGYDFANEPNAPGLYISWAWAVGQIMTAIEQGFFDNDISGIDVNKVAVTGMSRWGMGAVIIGGYARSKDGVRVAITDEGSGGNKVEGFLSVLGIDETWTNTAGAPGKTWYFKYIQPTPAPAGLGSPQDLTVKAVLPPELGGTDTYDFYWNGWKDPTIMWHGLGTYSGGREEAPSWNNTRFLDFQDLHWGMNLDDVPYLPQRNPYGYLCTIPWSGHSPSALIAPRGLLIHDGYKTIRLNLEGQYLAFLGTDEVYEFYKENNKTAHNYQNVPRNYQGIKFYFIPHAQPDYEIQDLWEFGKAYYANEELPAKFRDPPFPIRDPRSKQDYSKLYWARPGSTPLKDQIADVPDYPENWPNYVQPVQTF
jgi:hypothetical protein